MQVGLEWCPLIWILVFSGVAFSNGKLSWQSTSEIEGPSEKKHVFGGQVPQHLSNGPASCDIFRLMCQKVSALSSGVYVTFGMRQITVLPEIIIDECVT